ncbi:hypothetical protein ABZ896_37990 [Streptomyces sp. NPDC047072]|uniref:hypothetical protein n=1 Tax=Streptomyces sp. NPDC047072 TaxID=3154809 RepID=UPI0033D864C7
MPAPRPAPLALFAAALAERLPGMWTSEYHRHRTYADEFPTVERLWDLGHVDHIVSQYILGHDAVLTGPDGEQLYVTDRPNYRHQFVVAALEPSGVTGHQTSAVHEPNGIAVPNHPVRAAAAITRCLLPRYGTAVAADRAKALDQPEPPHRQPASAGLVSGRRGGSTVRLGARRGIHDALRPPLPVPPERVRLRAAGLLQRPGAGHAGPTRRPAAHAEGHRGQLPPCRAPSTSRCGTGSREQHAGGRAPKSASRR